MSVIDAPLVFLAASLPFGLASVVFLIVDTLFEAALSTLGLPQIRIRRFRHISKRGEC